MSQETWLVIVGGAVALASALVTAIVNSFLEGQRQTREWVFQLQDKKRDHQFAVLREKYEPALELMSETMKIVETSKTAQDAYSQLEALRSKNSYWAISVRLPKDDLLKDYFSMVIRYSRITESEEELSRYKRELVLAISEFNVAYDKERERLFEQKDKK